MDPLRPPATRAGVLRPAVAVLLILIGLATFGLWRVLSGNEDQPFADGATPPASARVTVDHTYSLAVPGGVRAMLAHGVPVAASSSGELINLQCTQTVGAGSAQAITVSAESTTTKAENTVGHFVATVSGAIHVDCSGWGAMFVPDSDNRPADRSGWALVIAVLTLSVGAPLAVSEIRMAYGRAHESGPADDDDEIEGFVDVAFLGGHDREVGGGDRDDVGP